MSKIGDKFVSKVKSIANAEFLDDSSESAVKVPFWEMCFLPIGVLSYKIKEFIKLAAVYAVFISVLAFATQMSYMCGINKWEDKTFFGCNFSPAIYVTFFLLRLLICSLFLKTWYKTAICGEKVEYKDMLTFSVQDWKIFGGMIVAVLFLCLPMVSIYALAYREPNPDWRIESIFFAFASSGFWLPFIGLRFSSLFAYTLSGNKRPALSLFWQRTTGNTLKIITALTLTVILNAIIFMNYDVLSSYVIEYTSVFGELLTDWLYNIIFLFMIASFASLAIVQRGILFYAANDK